jgi:hypothetical protein
MNQASGVHMHSYSPVHMNQASGVHAAIRRTALFPDISEYRTLIPFVQGFWLHAEVLASD